MKLRNIWLLIVLFSLLFCRCSCCSFDSFFRFVGIGLDNEFLDSKRFVRFFMFLSLGGMVLVNLFLYRFSVMILFRLLKVVGMGFERLFCVRLIKVRSFKFLIVGGIGFERLFFWIDNDVNWGYLVIIVLGKFFINVVLLRLRVFMFIKLLKFGGMFFVMLFVLRFKFVRFMFFKYVGILEVNWLLNRSIVCSDFDWYKCVIGLVKWLFVKLMDVSLGRRVMFIGILLMSWFF